MQVDPYLSPSPREEDSAELEGELDDSSEFEVVLEQDVLDAEVAAMEERGKVRT